LDYLKTDDVEYYKKCTQKDLIIDDANDDIEASYDVINVFRDTLVICKGI